MDSKNVFRKACQETSDEFLNLTTKIRRNDAFKEEDKLKKSPDVEDLRRSVTDLLGFSYPLPLGT